MSGFDAFIAIDWSGAGGRYDGIAVARALPGNASPRLVRPKAGRWTRSAVAEWLGRELKGGSRLLVGWDFAFALPFEPGLGYLGGSTPDTRDAFALWKLLDEAGCDDPDFGCAGIVADPRYASLFWLKGKQPKGWVLRQRRAEIDCAATTGTRPETIFKFIGAKQVGKASLTGMRVINHLRLKHANRVSVWPFEAATGSVLVEIYPTLFRKQAAGGLAKLRTRADLNAALKRLNSRGVVAGDYSDHDTDALISAAGLRSTAWSFPQVDERIKREGWIFGVPLPDAIARAA
jgi:hypothetical protein